ncbi:MAG: hypothetical protein Q9197_006029, partial [Variospora fuerteventurae]
NPDLFKSLADTLENVMQASVPKFVRMISADDLGQGSEAIRILGKKWLPPDNAQKDVSANGDVQEGGEATENNNGTPKNREKANEDYGTNPNGGQTSLEGPEAEEGDFVNVEMGFSYRASKIGKSMRVKAKNAHLYLVFYLPGGIQLPVWVELRGMVGFISLFVQNSIDAALAEYVAPKSLSLDLKGMLIGDDFKKNTSAHGVLFVRIISATGFKEGDRGITGLGRSTSDGYVSVGWAKLGKPLWSTRIIRNDMEPSWQETAFLLVGPNELNAGERLRVQLWDSDRNSADDDLGRVEVDLKELMRLLSWRVGYFPKTRIQQAQVEQQPLEPNVKSIQQLKDAVAQDVYRKMREASSQNWSPAFGQQMAQDLKSREGVLPLLLGERDAKYNADSMIAATAPPQIFPMGILSLQIHQISGLEYKWVNKSRDDDDTADDIVADYDDLPSSYCTIILNHQKIFKTRTKSKSSEPFFNAATERFIRDASTSVSRGKMYKDETCTEEVCWRGKKGRTLRLAVQ